MSTSGVADVELEKTLQRQDVVDVAWIHLESGSKKQPSASLKLCRVLLARECICSDEEPHTSWRWKIKIRMQLIVCGCSHYELILVS